MRKPDSLFDRNGEWGLLARFAERGRPGLGIVRGRRRHGKSAILRALAEQGGTFYYQAIRGVPTDQRRDLARAWAAHTGLPQPAFTDWGSAIDGLLSTAGVVVLDELPYLTESSPELESVLQRALDRAGPTASPLLVCGSSMTMMTKLLVGQAPLRGRAQLELEITPFDPPTMAAFTGLDPATAFGVHAAVGGVPGYLVDLLDHSLPDGPDDIERWLTHVAASPRRPLVHEARAMLELEAAIRDPGLYASVVGALAAGATRVGEIASRLGRTSDQIAHALAALADTGLVGRTDDALRRGRPTWRIRDPLLHLYAAVLRPNWALVEQGDPDRLGPRLLPGWRSQVLSPHLKQLARDWAQQRAPADVIGGQPTTVGLTVLNDHAGRRTHELDLVAIEDGQVIAIGEAKVRRMDQEDAARLAHLRTLIPSAEKARLIVVSATGFADGDWPSDVVRVGLADLFGAD